jgi:hypothetical protein
MVLGYLYSNNVKYVKIDIRYFLHAMESTNNIFNAIWNRKYNTIDRLRFKDLFFILKEIKKRRIIIIRKERKYK